MQGSLTRAVVEDEPGVFVVHGTRKFLDRIPELEGVRRPASPVAGFGGHRARSSGREATPGASRAPSLARVFAGTHGRDRATKTLRPRLHERPFDRAFTDAGLVRFYASSAMSYASRLSHGPPRPSLGGSWRATPAASRAPGVVALQADCTPTEALTMMKERAFVSHMTLLEVAELLIRHRIWFGVPGTN